MSCSSKSLLKVNDARLVYFLVSNSRISATPSHFGVGFDSARAIQEKEVLLEVTVGDPSVQFEVGPRLTRAKE
jgi:hypothetical protein